MAGGTPAINGIKLMKLLRADGWREEGRNDHGISLSKVFADGERLTTIADKSDSLAQGTLNAILGPLQTGIGRRGFRLLLKKHG